jgi:phosphate starvation-inducible PhoH-like protein
VIIIDEIQNMTAHELYTVLTRVGKDSRVILCGDELQSDLSKGKCWDKLVTMLDNIESVSIIDFGIDDIVRSGFVKEVIIAADKAGII